MDDGTDKPIEDKVRELMHSEGEAKASERDLIKERNRRLVRDVVDKEFADKAADEAFVPLSVVGLEEFLGIEHESTPFRIDSLLPEGGRLLMSAGAKTGKTRLVVHLAKVLVDGGMFLERFIVKPVEGTVVFVNLEMSESQISDWLRDAEILNKDKVVVVNMRGQAGSLDFRSPKTREKYAKQLKSIGAEVIIFDTLSKILDALGLSENSNDEVGPLLDGFDALMYESGLSELVLVHHHGHNAKRARGASKLLAWADALWDYTIRKETKVRLLAATGRDVELPEESVYFDKDTKRLWMSRLSPSPTVVKASAVEALVEEAVKADPGINLTTLREAVGGNNPKTDAAISNLESDGVIEVRKEGRSTCHYPA